MRKWIIDLSSWQPLTPEQWATMVANGLSGVIVRIKPDRQEWCAMQWMEEITG